MLAIAVLAPIVFFTALSWHEARHRQRGDAGQAARTIESQVVIILTEVRESVHRLAPLAILPCDVLMPEITRRAAVVPYLRSLNIIEGDHVSCSSALGIPSTPLWKFPGMPVNAPLTPWTTVVSSTPAVPGRPALLIGEPAPNGRSVFGVVDTRYLTDLMDAVAPGDVFREVELRIGDGLPVYAHGGPYRARGDLGAPLADVRFDAAGVPVVLRVYGLRSQLYATWSELLQQSMPIAIVLSGLLAWLYYQRQRNLGSWREQLLGAIRAGEFRVVYQPVYDVQKGVCAGVEALLRWDRPDAGPVSPDVFIEAAEQSRVAVPLTLHMLKLVAADVRHWNTPPGFHLGINMAAEHLSDERFLGDLRPFMQEVAHRQCQVAIEITERSLMKNTQQARYNLDTLRAEGAEVAIDDFGTGYCSLSYLETFPFDILKVDRGFAMTIDPARGDAIVLDAIISLAHQLKAKVVAEGVDQRAQFDYLFARGVSYMQGYLYAKPMPSAEFVDWYARNGQRPFEFCENATRVPDEGSEPA
ncbi:MAG TPA: EAL domain-containing protein [Paraburkholderia sp.]|nr:EAL domain-containing protein [Paraburkholderia sp.]